jgi:hypothetical protein
MKPSLVYLSVVKIGLSLDFPILFQPAFLLFCAEITRPQVENISEQ